MGARPGLKQAVWRRRGALCRGPQHCGAKRRRGGIARSCRRGRRLERRLARLRGGQVAGRSGCRRPSAQPPAPEHAGPRLRASLSPSIRTGRQRPKQRHARPRGWARALTHRWCPCSSAPRLCCRLGCSRWPRSRGQAVGSAADGLAHAWPGRCCGAHSFVVAAPVLSGGPCLGHHGAGAGCGDCVHQGIQRSSHRGAHKPQLD